MPSGCHDNGYVTNLRSQITAGFKQKLILLRSYSDMAAGIADLDLPVLTIPNLFLTQKLTTAPSYPVQNIQNGPPGLGAVSPSPRIGPTPCSVPVSTTLILPELVDHGLASAIPEPTAEPEVIAPRRPSIPPSYSSAVQVNRRVSTPDLDSSGSTSDASDDTSEHLTPPASPPTFSRPRHVNPNIVSLMVTQVS